MRFMSALYDKAELCQHQEYAHVVAVPGSRAGAADRRETAKSGCGQTVGAVPAVVAPVWMV